MDTLNDALESILPTSLIDIIYLYWYDPDEDIKQLVAFFDDCIDVHRVVPGRVVHEKKCICQTCPWLDRGCQKCSQVRQVFGVFQHTHNSNAKNSTLPSN